MLILKACESWHASISASLLLEFIEIINLNSQRSRSRQILSDIYNRILFE